ncbi:hypothetical protein [Planococcus lenghuensis]|uniref:Uncharacterized protein n=1 Tax=Planococcus lenghuensis TaxID=2213202 RepID=A0A1Q2KWK6_9BACL|nr:hypothetical protein [Planococcus lenghuensis]AQQ52605.1 hypothetical protein B0X71_05505 [Planococcus lenghuensis]
MRTLWTGLLLLSAGCSGQQIMTETIGNPTVEEVLDEGREDIFLLDDIVYLNGEEIDWVQEREYVLGEEVGEVTAQATEPEEFKDGTANVLPVGTVIYTTDTELNIAIVNGKKIPYIPLVEG